MDYSHDESLRNFSVPDSIAVSFQKVKDAGYNLFPFSFMEHTPKDVPTEELAILGEFINERIERFNIEDFDDPSTECVILTVTKNGIYTGDVLTASELDSLSQKYKRVYPGDFTYNPHRINVGSIGIVPNISEYMFVSNIYPVFSINDTDSMPNHYIQKILTSSEYKTIINDYCLGGARADLKLASLSRIKIRKPSSEQIETIANLSKQLEQAYNKYMDLLRKLKS